MTLPFLSARLIIRRLHDVAQRNILRQHQARFESTSRQTTARNASTSTPSDRAPFTIPGPGWGWIEPLATPFRAYGHMQKRRPLLTQWESSLVIYFMGDLSAQTVGSNFYSDDGATYEPIRGLRALVIASIISIPSYKYFLWLGRHFNYKYHWMSIAVKILVSQTLFTPVFNTYFFGMQSLLSGCNLEQTKRRIIDTVPISFVNSWKVWPAVTAFSFTFVQPQNRSVFAGCIAIFWQTYLSWLNKNAERAEGQAKGVEKRERKVVKKAERAVEGVKAG